MKTTAKVLLVTTALVLGSGVALAAARGDCEQGDRMRGHYGMGEGMHGGMGQGMHGGMGFPGMMSLYQLDDLTDKQEQQLGELRKQQHDKMFEAREAMLQSRMQMMQKIKSILTEDQLSRLREMR